MAEHTWYKCPGDHEYPGNCMFCDGGLGACTVCGGAEGTLPTDCPGEEMSAKTTEDIYAGNLDFREGRGWIVPDGTGKSMGDYKVENAEQLQKKLMEGGRAAPITFEMEEEL